MTSRENDLLSINHKNYNFRETNSQVIKERENLHYETEKEGQILNCNFECDWLIERVVQI